MNESLQQLVCNLIGNWMKIGSIYKNILVRNSITACIPFVDYSKATVVVVKPMEMQLISPFTLLVLKRRITVLFKFKKSTN